MRKIILPLLAFFFTAFNVQGQTAASYGFQAINGTYTSITGGTAVSILGDDLTQTSIPIGFTFNFCGVNYTTASACSNGWFSFSNSNSMVFSNLLANVGGIAPCVMPLWDDLGGASSSASYITTGTSPNRVFTMQWSNWEWTYNTTNVISFQVKLFETSNVIQCVYSPQSGTPSVAASATIGIAKTATDWQTLNNSTTSPTPSTTTFTTTIASKPGSGQIYQWSPPLPCNGTPSGTIAGPASVCANTTFSITATVPSVTGYTYDWQSSPAGANTFTSTGITTQNFTVVGGIATAKDYRLVITCTVSGATFTTNVLSVALNPTYLCSPCIPTYAFGGSLDNIANVQLGTLSNNTAGAGNVSPFYTSYVSQQPIPLAIPSIIVGGTATISITFGSDGSQYSRVWIDFNHDGIFSTTESFTNGTNAGGGGTANITITVPATALTGLTLMRIRGGDDSQPGAAQACGASNSGFGEAEDYLVNLIPPTPPAPTVVNNSPLCQGGLLTITATIPSGYPSPTFLLKGPGIAAGGVSSLTGNFSFVATPAFTGVDTVTVTSGGFTSPQTLTTVTVYPDPTISFGTLAGPTICGTATGSIQINGLAANTNYTVYYRKTAVQQPSIFATSTGTGSYTITGLTQGTYDSIRILTFIGGCYSNTLGPITLSDPNPPAAPVLTPNSPLCAGTTLTLTATSSGAAYPAGAPTVYTFAGPGSFSATGNANTSTLANFTAANNGAYTVYVKVNNCQSPTTTTNVTVTPASALPTVSNISYCANEIALPLTAGGQNLLWYTVPGPNAASPLGSGSITPPIPSTVNPGTTSVTTTYYVTQSAPCESPRAVLTVTIKPTPPAPIVTSPISFCQYEVVGPLTATGTALRWYATATGGVGSTTAPTPVTTTPGTYNFYVSQIVAGCEGPRATITVTIKAKPAPPFVQPLTNLCQNDPPAPLTAIGQNLLWYTTPTGGVGVSVAPVPNTGYEDSFFYYVSQTVAGCESDRSLMKVVVNYRPNGIIIYSRPWVCDEDTLKFTYYGNAHPDATYIWHVPPGDVVEDGSGTQGPLTVRFFNTGDQLISLQIDNKGCLSPLLTTSVNVRELPAVSFVRNREDICTDQVVTVAIHSISGNISDYNWTGFDGATVAFGTYNGGPFGLSWSQPGIHAVSLVVTSRECNSHAAIDTINVHAYPDATIHYDGESLSLCSGDSLKLSVIPGIDPATYEWSPAAFFYNRSDSTPVVYVTPKFGGEIKVLVTSIYGCAAKDSVGVDTKPCCGVTFPTAFSPNEDGHNDRFRPITIGNHQVKSFRVINRWGQVVYESQDERKGWDGTFSGVAQDMGMYYWYFRYVCADGQDLEEKGEVMLMR